VAVAIIGIAIARWFYGYKPDPRRHRTGRPKPLYTLLYNKWYVDELYDSCSSTACAKAAGWSRLLRPRGGGWRRQRAGWLTRFTSRVSIWWDTWIIDGAVRAGSFFVEDAQLPGVHPRDPAACKPTPFSWWWACWASWDIS